MRMGEVSKTLYTGVSTKLGLGSYCESGLLSLNSTPVIIALTGGGEGCFPFYIFPFFFPSSVLISHF